MNNEREILKKLAKKVLDGTATDAEQEFLDEYYRLFDKSEVAGELDHNVLEGIDLKLRERLSKTIAPAPVRRIQPFTRLRVAASIALLLLAGTAVYFLNASNQPARETANVKVNVPAAKIVAGGNKAILTLADGTQVLLDEQPDGKVASEQGIQIEQKVRGQLSYLASSSQKARANQINLLQTPRGGLYQLELSDGTKVWLNSASKLKYPVSFTGAERRVELEGEAYFEVAHRDDQPFRVVSKDQTIEVLGTHFNVESYPDQSSNKTTLVEGRVKVTPAHSHLPSILHPGQQSSSNGSEVKVKTVDTDVALAWKEGLFRFDNDDIYSIMNKISRWYDVDIIYEDNLNDIHFGGSVSRFSDIEKVLSKLELTNRIHFKIEGRKIIVTK